MATSILRFVMGIDTRPVPLSQQEVDTLLQDSFAAVVLKGTAGPDRPQSFEDLINVIVQKTPKSGFSFFTFLVGEGSQVPVSVARTLSREYRFVWTRNLTGGSAGNLGSPSAADIMVVGSSATASTTAFLQCLAWDPVNERFNFYARSRQGDDETGDAASGLWVYAGNSAHAFVEGSRGKGPFDGHVSGSLVMKELKKPWNSWNSSAARIDMLADPVLSRSAFVQALVNAPQDQGLGNADNLQTLIVEPGIAQWTSSRLKRTVLKDGTIAGNARFLLQHALATPTVNFASSPDRSFRPFATAPPPIRLPLSFFVNSEALSHLGISANAALQVPYALYRETLKEYGFRLRGSLDDGSEFVFTNADEGAADTMFAFFVPEPAFADNQVVSQLVEGSTSFVSARLMACLLLVDFWNPVYSAHRLQLMDFVPVSGTTAAFADDGAFVKGILAAAAQDTAAGAVSGATEFARWWALGAEVVPEGQAAVRAYLQKASARLADPAGARQAFADYTELSISRRFEFSNTPLDEFPLTLPVTRIDETAPLLQMTQDAGVQMKSAQAVNLLRSLGRVPKWTCAKTPLVKVPVPAAE